MKHIGLFEGIGGFSLAAHWIGWETIAWCEWNPFGQQFLKYHFPNATGHGDITKTDFTIYRGQCDILTGGFPCQPYSNAGKRLGKEDDRHLWPEMLRAIREIQPTWVVGENVSGLISWNEGLVFHEVQTDLEAEGYEVQPFVLPACAVNAPHRRDRVWFIAYSDVQRDNRMHGTEKGNNERQLPKNNKQSGHGWASQTERYGKSGTTPNPDSNGQHRSDSEHEVNTGEKGQYAQRDPEPGNEYGNAADTVSSGCKTEREQPKPTTQDKRIEHSRSGWERFPTQPPVCGRNDGVPEGMVLDAISYSKWRNESIKAMGNAIVPQVALQIFKAIEIMQNDPHHTL